MSQARGRYTGPRDSGQRQPRRADKPPGNRQGKSYAKAPPQDPAQTASIFKTRSFQFLVNTVGAENIALGLDSNMTRVAELMKGEKFTSETAFHMETALGLSHGFFDQPHPALAPETIARLKSPLDSVRTEAEIEAASELLEPAPGPHASHPSVLDQSLTEEAEMPKKATSGSPRAAKYTRSKMAESPKPHAPRKDPPAKSETSARTAQQQAALSDSAAVEKIRRANLHVLTSRNGSKAKLGVVMALSGSNMAHRLHGKKRMDNVEANRFTERLGLPDGWLDMPRSEAEIPDSVSRLLTPASRGRALTQQHQPHTATTTDRGPRKLADAKAPTGDAQEDESGNAEGSTGSADIAKEKETFVESAQHPGDESSDERADRLSEDSHGETPSTMPSDLEPLRTFVIPQQDPIPLISASVTSLENLNGIEPIAEALIKTLAGKARTGRLGEMKALELLQQVVLL
ncbi:hypothetical protein AWB81_07126 [Caballeronia arationis]|uniref:hypothetical protein n=1 Tax=Caballeronia arationis TaxID=1777142 RepID=UPI00074B7ADC|nr:hypothetical protein [Caballeronia arationis]SAL05360.1 hypothetical protein AWB81_07126 [Caballeronia arationis]